MSEKRTIRPKGSHPVVINMRARTKVAQRPPAAARAPGPRIRPQGTAPVVLDATVGLRPQPQPTKPPKER